VEVVELLVDHRRDPADGLAVALGDEVLGVGVLEVRVLLLVEELLALPDERRDPALVVAVDRERQLDEALEVRARADGADFDRHGAAGYRA
jgi:hypothetical protein